MLKAEKAWAWQTPRTLCWEELWLLMLLCDRLPGILLLPATRNRVAFSGSRMSRASNNFCHARRTKSSPRFNILPVLLIQFAFVQQSSSHQSPVPNIEQTCRCQAVTTVRKPFSPQFPFLQRVRSMKSVSFAMLKAEKAWAWQTPQTLCWKSFGCWCCCVTGFQESYCYQLPGIALPFPGREWAEHQTAFATLGEQKVALVQYLASVANSMGIRAAIQFTSITSTKHRAHMQVSSSDRCDRAILSTVSIFAKGQINEECLPCNVESWESLSLADTSELVLGRALVADAAVWQASRNPIATSYQESRCLFRFENEPSIKQLLPCSENRKFP